MNAAHRIRRFVHSDGQWINIANAEGMVVQFSGKKGSTVPYFQDVVEETVKPEVGRSADDEMDKMAAEFTQQKFTEVLPNPNPSAESKIDNLWRQIENWFYEHTPVFCRWPLAPAASEEELQMFEKMIDAKFPEDIRQSYLKHNGSADVRLLSVVGEGKWVTLHEAAAHWKGFQEIRPDLEAAGYLETPKGPMKMVHISSGWIPISDNSGGDHLCVDLDPAEGGTVGQLFSYWHEYGAWRLVATSFTAFLERLLKHLTLGRYAINEEGQLAPANGPAPESVEDVQEFFLRD